MSKINPIAVFFTLCSCLCLAQTKESEREILRLQEEAKKTERQLFVNRQLDSAILLMEEMQYTAANEKFLFVLKNVNSVPSDLAFYFGKNSFFLNKYKQAADWLNKYIQLKGTSGKFSKEAVSLQQMAEQKILEERQVIALQAKEILSRDYEIDCGPSGKVICPVCSGTTVIVKKNYLSETYKPCTHCQKRGYLNCEEYNALLRGEFNPK
jgi:tetratricopeptide (TPR) repeat protein